MKLASVRISLAMFRNSDIDSLAMFRNSDIDSLAMFRNSDIDEKMRQNKMLEHFPIQSNRETL